MLSRRNIRIRVMQLLYALDRDQQLNYDDIARRYHSYTKKTLELYLFNLLQFADVAAYSELDAQNRKAKLLPSDADKAFLPKLSQNELLLGLTQSDVWQKLIKKYMLSGRVDKDASRSLYQEFQKGDSYKNYLNKKDCTNEDHLSILLELYKLCNNSEIFNDLMEDLHPSWLDDKSLIVGAAKKTIKGLPEISELYQELNEEDIETNQFGDQLLFKTRKHDKELFELIEPMLKNWDADRVAILDMIMLKMAVAELLYFPTIPTKVTLNEYVDISKIYSTDKSKEFINGILDKLLKKLQKDNLIKKEGRGLVD